MTSQHPIDLALETLRAHADKHGLHRIEVSVYADGRVAIYEMAARGSLDVVSNKVRADLAEGSPDQLPSAAFFDLAEARKK